MTPSANILAIHALDDLKAALARFRGEAQDTLSAAAQEIQRTLDWLAERVRYWQNEVRRREEAVRQAEAVLARCQASGYRDKDGHDHQPDCSAYQAAVLQARVRVHEAEAELRNVQQWTRLIQQAVTDYQREAQRLYAILSGDLPKASALLANSANILHSYAAMSAPTTGPANVSGSSTSTSQSHAAIDTPMTSDQIKAILTEGLSKGVKGEVLEEITTRIILKDSDNVLVHRHPHVNDPGFDPVFYNQRTGEVIISEMKNWGTADNPRIVHFNGNKGPKAWDNLEKNERQVRQSLENNPGLDATTRQKIIESLDQGNVRFIIVTGPFTRLSPEWDDVLAIGDTFSHISFEQLYSE